MKELAFELSLEGRGRPVGKRHERERDFILEWTEWRKVWQERS